MFDKHKNTFDEKEKLLTPINIVLCKQYSIIYKI